MLKAKNISIFIIIIGVFIIGYLLGQPGKDAGGLDTIIVVQNNTPIQQVVYQTEKPICEKNAIQCWQAVALEKGDAQYCVKINVDYQRDECYSEVANKNNNPTLCMGIIYPELRYSCYRRINLKGLNTDTVCSSGWTVEARKECREKIEEANK
jgi:hypothetical protein